MRIGAGGVEPQTSAGILIDGSPGVRVIDSVVRNEVDAFQSDGVVVLGSPGTVLRGNRLERNAWNGAVVIESPGARVTGNELDGNGNNGLEVNGASDGAVVALNHAAGNAQFGLVVGASSDARVVGNDVSGNPEAGILSFDLIDGLLAGNGATGNGVGILLRGRPDRVARQPRAGKPRGAQRRRGHPAGSGADDNEVRGNEASGNGGGDGFGIIVFEGTGNVLADNVANANAADGILHRGGDARRGRGQHADPQRREPQRRPRHRRGRRHDRRRRQPRPQQRDAARLRRRGLLLTRRDPRPPSFGGGRGTVRVGAGRADGYAVAEVLPSMRADDPAEGAPQQRR